MLVKAGTNLLTATRDHLDLELMASLAEQIAVLRQGGVEVALVTSGAVAAGRQVLDRGKESRDINFRQVLAAVGQARLMHAYEQLFAQKSINVAQALLTRGDLTHRQSYLNVRNTLLTLLELGVVPIINENDVVAVEELHETFGDNDALSAMVAGLIEADVLIMLSDIGGLYTADPHVSPSARLIPRVERIDGEVESMAGSSWSRSGRGGMAAKLDAARLATTAGVPVIIADGRERDVLVRLAGGEAMGTYFSPAVTRLESRKRWMLSGLNAKRAIVVDGGAARALQEQSRSLLPAGVQRVRGEFQRGDIVAILGPDDARIACGISNYSAAEVERIKGLRSDRIGEALGCDYGAEVVHRNNMVVL
ncbi:MAG: glutamate 5-kinase [Chloroflexi bacterium]|nr:glutamate 5-kinase [Chloroflexota bacterium]